MSSPGSSPVYILGTSETYVKKFRLFGSKTTFKFNKPPAGFDEFEWVRKGLAHLVNEMKNKSIGPNDYLGFTLRSLNFANKEPGYVAFKPVREVEEDTIWTIFSGIIQSNEGSFTSSDTFTIEATVISLPVGSGPRRAGFYNSFREECSVRRGVVQIKNIDNLCLPRAIVVAKAHAKKDPHYKAIQQDKKKRQTIKAEKLMAKARVQIPAGGAGILELEKFQAHLRKYKINMYN